MGCVSAEEIRSSRSIGGAAWPVQREQTCVLPEEREERAPGLRYLDAYESFEQEDSVDGEGTPAGS